MARKIKGPEDLIIGKIYKKTYSYILKPTIFIWCSEEWYLILDCMNSKEINKRYKMRIFSNISPYNGKFSVEQDIKKWLSTK